MINLIFNLDINPADLRTAQHKGARVIGKHVHFFTKPEVIRSNDMVRQAMEKSIIEDLKKPVVMRQVDAYGKKMFALVMRHTIAKPTPVFVSIVYSFPFPKSTPKSLLQRGWCWMTERPDIDNVTKGILDVMTSLGIWEDDSQIVSLDIQKKRCIRHGIFISVDTAPVN